MIRRWPAPPSDMVEPNELLRSYDPAPVRAMGELISGISRVRDNLGRIRVPALVAHSTADRFVPLSSTQEIAAHLGGAVETLFLDGSGHAITADAKRLEVAEASRAFLQQHIAAHREASALSGLLAPAAARLPTRRGRLARAS